jgi:hypothetical protein
MMLIYETRHTLLIGMRWRSIALSSRKTGYRLDHFYGFMNAIFPGNPFYFPQSQACRKKTQNLLYILSYLSLFPCHVLEGIPRVVFDSICASWFMAPLKGRVGMLNGRAIDDLELV